MQGSYNETLALLNQAQFLLSNREGAMEDEETHGLPLDVSIKAGLCLIHTGKVAEAEVCVTGGPVAVTLAMAVAIAAELLYN